MTEYSCWIIGMRLFLENWGVHFVGVLVIRALLSGVYIGAADFWKLLCQVSQC